MDFEKQIKHADSAIKNAMLVQKKSRALLQKNNVESSHSNLVKLEQLNNTMKNVAKMSDKAMKGAKLAESRAKSRLMAVKKASTQVIHHTARAKRAAIASKKSAEAAVITLKKIGKKSNTSKKHQRTFNIQVQAAMRAAKESEYSMKQALKASKVARLAARMPLEAKKI